MGVGQLEQESASATFVSPSPSSSASVETNIAHDHEKEISPTAAPNQSSVKAAEAKDDTLDVVIHDLLKISSFVYTFREIRNIVKTNDGKIMKKKRTGLLKRPEKCTVAFDTPAHILTQDGAYSQKDTFLKYKITPDAIKLFLEKNRKWFYEARGGALKFDKSVTEKTEPFVLENEMKIMTQDNLKIVDYDDEFSTNKGGLVYGVVINLTRKWVTVAFRGTVGKTDVWTDLDFKLDYDSFFKSEDNISILSGGKPGTHAGFTKYLVDEKMSDQDGRKCLERILACVNGEFKNNEDVVGKDFKLYVTGHSLGGGLANLFAFRTAQLKAMDDESVKFLPDKITALTFAAPVVGNYDYNKEFQSLEKRGILRHIRVANEGDVVPTNEIFFPASLALKGNTKEYTQNGVNLFLLRHEEGLVIDYRNTKSCSSQFGPNPKKNAHDHSVAEYKCRLNLDENNKKIFQQTVEEIYATAGDFTN